jgi:hypothetical protein
MPSDIEWGCDSQKTICRTGQRSQREKNGKQPINSMYNFIEMPEMRTNLERKNVFEK